MQENGLAGSPLLQSLLHRVTWRRYRVTVLSAILLTLLSTIWIYGRIALDISGLCPAKGIVTSSPPNDNETLPNSSQNSSTSEWKEQNPAADPEYLIPPKIWQILLPKKPEADEPINPERLQDTASWLGLNTDYTYTLVGQKGANQFVKNHFEDSPEIVDAYRDLRNVGMKSDLLRYLILDKEGGVYSDTDTIALKPIDKWVPPNLRDKIRLIVGIEFDRRDGGGWADIPHWLQFCQWTIAAAPGHPVFQKMVTRILESTEELSQKYEIPVDQLQPTSFEVMNTTGPAAWTDVVFAQLQEYEPTLNTTKDLSFMTEPKLYGDILVLNIDGFGMGQTHSHSTHDGTIPELALVKHLFRGTWRGD